MKILIQNGRCINPATKTDHICDIYVENHQILDIGEHLSVPDDVNRIDASGQIIFPGFIDLHVHFRDPGQTQKEDLYTGSRAAAHGGFTSVFAMPNTNPVVDCPQVAEDIRKRSCEIGMVHLYQVGSLTIGMKGEELSDYDGMMDAGVIAFSEDGKSVMNSALLRKAMRKLAGKHAVILDHCEDIDLVEGGVMNAGDRADSLGLKGISNAVENIIVARDIMLAKETGAKLHLCHCSTKESALFLKLAKEKGIKVSGEVCPHHFILTEEDIVDAKAAEYKMNPPLRSKEDRDALEQGLSDGTFEAISTDHAPHTSKDKSRGFEGSPFGIVGLETAASLTYTTLVLSNQISLMQMAEKMSYNPAQIAGINAGDLSVGKPADITIFDPSVQYEIHASDFLGKAVNMPYENRKVAGRVTCTICNGAITYQDTTIGNK